MGNIHNLSVIRQCFSYISEEYFCLPISDHRVRKLTTLKSIKLILASQLAKWDSYEQISQALRTSTTLQESLELSSISGSQISRRLKTIPTEILEGLFLELIGKVKQKALPSGIKDKQIRIIDSTCLKLPATLASWAYVTRDHTQIKIHVRVLVLTKNEEKEVIPEKAIPTTGNVSDYETMNLLVEDDGTIYVMDRGYVKYKQFDTWLEQKVQFVTRINENHRVWQVEQELPVDPDSNITRDAIVQLGSAFRKTENSLRLVEFLDEKGRKYRLATSCLDLSAEEIADIYRQRWLIELFFKWMKQHLRLVKLYSYDPQGIWNQIFIALIAYAIAMLIHVSSGTRMSLWEVLQSLRLLWEKPNLLLETELRRRSKSQSNKGRQRGTKIYKEPPIMNTSVGIIKPRGK